jgi:uncharacterized protein YodC (DUF2158 family)
MTNTLKLGDQVQLISGGPVMTVDKLSVHGRDNAVLCVWFDGGAVKSQAFSPESLQAPRPESATLSVNLGGVA